ncbi:MAG: GNAT family N-acetyltransferase [Treponema sp.]|nr:GNAT family N-acetyltransferase [Treponema sp.]
MINYIERAVTPCEFNLLRKSVGWNEFNENEIGKSLEHYLYSIAAVDDSNDRIVGMGRVLGDEKIDFFIKDIIIVPEYQGKHIGTTIMNKIMEYINRNAVDLANVALMAAKDKETFYERFGFSVRPNTRQGAGMNLKIITNLDASARYGVL